jgi:hypothetical protein
MLLQETHIMFGWYFQDATFWIPLNCEYTFVHYKSWYKCTAKSCWVHSAFDDQCQILKLRVLPKYANLSGTNLNLSDPL